MNSKFKQKLIIAIVTAIIAGIFTIAGVLLSNGGSNNISRTIINNNEGDNNSITNHVEE